MARRHDSGVSGIRTTDGTRFAAPLRALRLGLASLVAVCLTLGAGAVFGLATPTALAAPPPPPPLPGCSAGTTIFGVLPDSRTITITLLLDGPRGTLRYGAREVTSLDHRIVAIAALDNTTVLALDDAGALHEIAVAGSWQGAFVSTDAIVATGRYDDKLAYDGAGHLYGTVDANLVRYAVTAAEGGYAVGEGEEIGSGFSLTTMVAVGTDTLLAAAPSGEWIVYTISGPSGVRPGWTRRSLGTATATGSSATTGSSAAAATGPAAVTGPSAATGWPAAVSAGGVVLLPVGAGSYLVRNGSGAMQRVDGADTAAMDPALAEKSVSSPLPAPDPAASTPPSANAFALRAERLAPNAMIDTHGWTQTLLSVAPSACGAGMSSESVLADPHRLIGRSRDFNGFSDGWCTEGAAMLFNQASGYWMDITGDAWKWAQAAGAAGWGVTTIPAARSVVVFQPFVSLGDGVAASALGHVAWVDAVAARGGEQWFHIVEMNGPAGRGNWDQRWVKDDPAVNVLTGQPNMQFILAP